MNESQEFDYIIVGGGSSGAATAARLSEKNPDAQVALIEAGPDDAGIDEVLSPVSYTHLTLPTNREV